MQHGIYTMSAEALAEAHVAAISAQSRATIAMIEREWARRSRTLHPDRFLRHERDAA